jgi:hypothetical protein
VCDRCAHNSRDVLAGGIGRVEGGGRGVVAVLVTKTFPGEITTCIIGRSAAVWERDRLVGVELVRASAVNVEFPVAETGVTARHVLQRQPLSRRGLL